MWLSVPFAAAATLASAFTAISFKAIDLISAGCGCPFPFAAAATLASAFTAVLLINIYLLDFSIRVSLNCESP
jgi:hypothetical protein